MKQTYITINDVAYPVVFTMLTMNNFEEITNDGFFKANWDKTNVRMALIMAAALAADEDTKLTIEALRGQDTFDDYKQIADAFNVIMTLASDFFKIPVVDEEKGKSSGEEKGESSKN
jgi:hypothetical protein